MIRACPSPVSLPPPALGLTVPPPCRPGRLALFPEVAPSFHLLLSQPGCGVMAVPYCVLGWEWSHSFSQLGPARKLSLKCLCSPCAGAAPPAVYSPLILLFPGPAGHNQALGGPCCPISCPGPTWCRSGRLLQYSAGVDALRKD